VYEIAARQRRINQNYTNQQHPLRNEDVWICQFCEYESIFGKPPMALIRQYEIKDRKAQKALADRRRMLEKVKQKGRKNKKNSKASHKTLAHQAAEFQKREFLRNTGGLPGNPQAGGPHDPMMRGGDDGLYHPDDEYDADDFDEDGRPLAYDGEDYVPDDDAQYYEEDDIDDDPHDTRPPHHHPPSMGPPVIAGPSGQFTRGSDGRPSRVDAMGHRGSDGK
jgi:hypothetical protein